MKSLRRVLFIPVVAILIASLLIILKIYTHETLEPYAFWTFVATCAVFVGLLIWEARDIVTSWEMPEPEDPPKSEEVIYPKPIDKATEALKTAEEYAKHSNGRVKIKIDIEDSKDKKDKKD
jgi:hypothetical protein